MTRRRGTTARWMGRALLGVLLPALQAGCGDDLRDQLPGTYVLDAPTYEAEALERRIGEVKDLDEVPRDVRAARVERFAAEARAETAGTLLRLVLADDGRFQIAWRYGSEDGQAAGSWSLEGDRLELATTEERGRPLATPERTSAIVQPGPRLRLDGPGVPQPATLARVGP